jgi:hypothetical protein
MHSFRPPRGGNPGQSAHALEVYDPEWEAVVVTSRDEGVYVVIVRAAGAETVGGLIFTKTQ